MEKLSCVVNVLQFMTAIEMDLVVGIFEGEKAGGTSTLNSNKLG
jgi:hypothetical protein